MFKNLIFLYSFVLIFTSLFASAQSPSSDDLIKELSSCNSDFFKAIKRNDSYLKQFAPIDYNDDVAYWRVPDRNDNTSQVLKFSTPIEGKISLIGYEDSISDLGLFGLFYTWGFLANGSPNNIAKIVKNLIKDGDRLRKDGDVFVRSDILYTNNEGSSWKKNDDLSGGTVPKKGTVERVLLVEELEPGVTLIICSLQGSVKPQLLASERPDIAQ